MLKKNMEVLQFMKNTITRFKGNKLNQNNWWKVQNMVWVPNLWKVQFGSPEAKLCQVGEIQQSQTKPNEEESL
jgi:hypothetical protein